MSGMPATIPPSASGPELSARSLRSHTRELPPRWQRHLRLALGFATGQLVAIMFVSAFTAFETERRGAAFRILLPILLFIVGCASGLGASRAYRPQRPFVTGTLAGIACASITLTLIITAWSLQLI